VTAIKSLTFHKLKRLQNVVIEFPEKGFIALMGENGIGKTTVLHALACLFKPHQYLQLQKGDNGSWWTDWFVPHTGNLWNGSLVEVKFHGIQTDINYKKKERWSPRKEKRIERYCRYIGFRDCMPHIELENQRSHFEFQLSEIDLSEAKRGQLLEAARTILNRNYVSIKRATKRSGLVRFLYATVIQGIPPAETSYTSHYMGAGEQKTLKLIEEIVRAPNGALLIFEEFEVAIHESALRRLIPWIAQEAATRDLQIVVSTHWPRMPEFTNLVQIRTLHSTPAGNLACIVGSRPALMHQLTGDLDQLSLIRVWVEDKLAARVTEQIAAELNLLANVRTKTFGSVENAFSVASTLELDGANSNSQTVVLDGDRYRTPKEKLSRLESTLTGTGEQIEIVRKNARRWITQLNPVTEDFASPIMPMKPERFLLDSALRAQEAGHASHYIRQFFDFAAANIFADPDKSLIYNIHIHFQIPMDRVEDLLIQAASLDPAWGYFTSHVRERLILMATELKLIDAQGED
jgi:energy-coupling factor transporter ATP-binding protein EcfA2